MFSQFRARHVAGSIALAAGIAASGALVAQPASAATLPGCQASAVNLSLLGAATTSANVANPANSPCIADHNGNDVTGLTAIIAYALDTTTATTPGVSASAEAKVVGLHADASSIAGGLVPQLTSGANSIIPAVSTAVAAQIGASGSVNTALAPLKALGLNIGSVNNVALTTDTQNALPTALSTALPDLVDAGLIDAQASAICASGVATLSGHVTLTGTTVLGQDVNVNDAVGKVLSVDTSQLTLSQLVSVTDVLKSITVQPSLLTDVATALGSSAPNNLYDVLTNPLLAGVNPHLPTGTTVSTILSAVDAAVAPVLASTTIPLPADLVQATITPQTSAIVAGVQTTTALTVSFTGLGQSLLSGSLAQASVNGAAAACDTPLPTPKPTPTPTPTPNPADKLNADAMLKWQAGPAAAVLACTDTKLRLIDVRQDGKTTLIKGVTDASLIGQPVTVFIKDGRKKVATTTVDSDGVFTATAALPRAGIRDTNSARYYATVGGTRTNGLKFARRMYTTGLSRSGSTVKLSGYITTPLARTRDVVIQRRVTCDTYRTVAKATAKANGKFSVTFTDPATKTSAIYRAQAIVPNQADSKRKYNTYTLPQPLAL